MHRRSTQYLVHAVDGSSFVISLRFARDNVRVRR